MRNGIFGHTSEQTAYLIADYPYGRTLRCQRKVWLEHDKRHGYRFVAQTDNPKNGRWNKPHKSTYIDIAACLYLDDESHVQWCGIGFLSSAEQALAFARDFGKRAEGAEALRVWALKKSELSRKLATGEAHFTINGVKEERSERQLAEDGTESATWAEVARLLSAE